MALKEPWQVSLNDEKSFRLPSRLSHSRSKSTHPQTMSLPNRLNGNTSTVVHSNKNSTYGNSIKNISHCQQGDEGVNNMGSPTVLGNRLKTLKVSKTLLLPLIGDIWPQVVRT